MSAFWCCVLTEAHREQWVGGHHEISITAAWGLENCLFIFPPGRSLRTSSAHKEIADRSHRRRSLLHGEMADARHHEDLRLRNETRPDFRLTGRHYAVLLAPRNQSFVGNAAQPTTEFG